MGRHPNQRETDDIETANIDIVLKYRFYDIDIRKKYTDIRMENIKKYLKITRVHVADYMRSLFYPKNLRHPENTELSQSRRI